MAVEIGTPRMRALLLLSAIVAVVGACTAQAVLVAETDNQTQESVQQVGLDAGDGATTRTSAPAPRPTPVPKPTELPAAPAEPTQAPAEQAAVALQRFVDAPSMAWSLLDGDGYPNAAGVLAGDDMAWEGIAGRMLQLDGTTYVALPLFLAESRGVPVAAPESVDDRVEALFDRTEVVWVYEANGSLGPTLNRLPLVDPAFQFLQSIPLRDANQVRHDIAELQRLILDAPDRTANQDGFIVQLPTAALAELLFLKIHGFYYWPAETVGATVRSNDDNTEVAIFLNEGGAVGEAAVLVFEPAPRTTLEAPEIAMPLTTSAVAECSQNTDPLTFSPTACESMHMARVFAQFVPPDAAVELDTSEHERRCRDIFNVYTGGLLVEPPFKALRSQAPTETELAAGLRTVTCVVEFTNPVVGPLHKLTEAG